MEIISAFLDKLNDYMANATTNLNVDNEPLPTKKTHLKNPVISRINKDLKSPSASARLRAIKAMKSPTRSAYAQFDVPHDEQCIISQEERINAAKPPLTLAEIMKGVVVYAEVRTGDDNRSEGVRKVIAALGIRVSERLIKKTTHVVFKDGLLSTYKKAKSWNIPVVSILWIEACKNQKKICDPLGYPISNLDRYENPELYEKIKRYKSMQTGSECNKRVRAKVTKKDETPDAKTSENVASTPTATTKRSQTDISHYFKALDKNPGTPVNRITAEAMIDSPATVLLRRMTSTSYTPLASKTKTKRSGNNVADQYQQSTPLNARVGSVDASIAVTTDSIANLSIYKTPSESSQAEQLIGDTMQVANDKKKYEEMGKIQSKSADLNNRKKSGNRCTTFNQKPMEISAFNTPTTVQPKPTGNCRRTLYTPEVMMEASSLRAVASETNKFGFCENSDAMCTPPIERNDITISSAKITQSLTIMSSAHILSRNNGRRRTLFDVSMDIINQNVQNINSNADFSMISPSPPVMCNSQEQQSNNAPTNNANTASDNLRKSDEENKPSSLESSTTEEKKKRKLFKTVEPLSPFTAPIATPVKSKAQSDRKSLSGTKSVSKTATKRRRTLMSTTQPTASSNSVSENASDSTPLIPIGPKVVQSASRIRRRSTMDFQPAKSSTKLTMSQTQIIENESRILKPNNCNHNNENSGRPIAKKRLPFLAYTNMHKEQVEVINEAVRKLGRFQLEKCVGSSTTHMISLEPRRTMNLLRGLVRGLWILEFNWIVDSLNAGQWQPEEQYEMKDFSRAVKICRAERQAFGSSYKCELFADLGAFYISPRCDNIPVRELKDLIRLCSGKVVDQRQNAKYILSGATKAFDDKIYVTPLWILDSITQMQLMRIQKYSAVTQLPTTHTPSNTRNMPTAVDPKGYIPVSKSVSNGSNKKD